MDSSSPSNRHPVVPPDEHKCVWMTAGILSYQLCERALDCDSCPLDAAIRMHFTRPVGAEGGRAMRPGAPEIPSRLPADRVYSRNHCWVRTMGRTPDRHRVARVGLEPGLAESLLMPKAVVLPSVGERLKRQRAHLWVVADGGTFAVSAPTDGVVTAVNSDLTQRPHTIASLPLEDGWIFEMDVCENEIKGGELMPPEEAGKAFAADQARFQAQLAEALQGDSPRVGATLADGGVALQHVSDMLGAATYFALLRQAYR
jgi:glycine cleavage system H protein